MESNSNATDSTNEADKPINAGEMNENSEESCKNEDINTKQDMAKEASESSEEHRDKTNDKSERKEENVDGAIKTSPQSDEHVCASSSAPVTSMSSVGNSKTCPEPPTRQRRKSRTGSDKVKVEEKETQEEKAHGGRGESEGQEMEEREKNRLKREEGGFTNAAYEEDCEETIHGEEKITEQLNGDAQTDHTKPTPTHRNRKEGRKDKRNKETIPPIRDQNIDLEEGKNEIKDKKKTTDDDDKKRSLVGLKKELGLMNCVGIIVGNIIGTGIFIAPGAVLQYTGSVGMSLVVWILSGLGAIVGAFCYAELGTMIPQSGGNYTYLHEAFGPLPAFLYVWLAVMVNIPIGRAIVALSFANYLTQPFFPDDVKPPDTALKFIGILLIVTLTYINCRRVRWATRVQDSLAVTKVLALIMIIVVGLFHLARGTTDNYDHPMEGTSPYPANVATAFFHTLYAYGGWDGLNEIMEELKDPFRNMPRAIAISIATVIVIYVLTNVAYFAVLPKDLMLASPAVAVTFGNLSLGVMAWTIPIFVACSITGGVNGGVLLSSRLIFVSARRGQLPRALSLVQVDNSTPVIALVFTACISMVMFVTSNIRILINYLMFANNIMTMGCIASFFWFRWKKPDQPRPIKVWIGFPIIYSVLSLCLCIFPAIRQPFQILAAAVIMGSGVLVFYLLVNKEQKPQGLVTAMDKVTYVCQVLFMAAPEEKATCGDAAPHL